MLRRAPAFTLVALVTLAFSVGAGVADIAGRLRGRWSTSPEEELRALADRSRRLDARVNQLLEGRDVAEEGGPAGARQPVAGLRAAAAGRWCSAASR
jgi:hypothetical protein